MTPSAASSAAVFAGPTWEELGRKPPLLRSGGAADGEQGALAELLAALRSTAGWKDDSIVSILRLRSIRRLGHETTARLRLREEAKAALLRLGGEVRRVHAEMARRLVADGVLSDLDDVDLLTPYELRRAVVGASAIPMEVIFRRRRWRTRYGQEGPLPQRFRGVPEAVEIGSIDGDRIEGWAASPGRFRGTVQVVRSPEEELNRDAVLVAEATDASWSPLFIKAGAIVLDRGGPLSHAAILARELGVPAVLNVPGATSLLEGREVTVDGDAGIVTLHDDAPVRSGAGS